MPTDKDLSRKEKITKAAKYLFRHYGFMKTTIEDISREADIGKGSIYLEFSSKQEIMLSIVEEFLDKQIRKIEQVTQGKDIKSYVDLFQESLVNYVLETYDLAYPYSHNAESFIHTSSRVRNEMRQYLNKIQDLFGEMLEKANTQQEINLHTKTKEIVNSIFICSSPLFPPYDCTMYLEQLTREELEKQTKAIMYLTMNGIKRV